MGSRFGRQEHENFPPYRQHTSGHAGSTLNNIHSNNDTWYSGEFLIRIPIKCKIDFWCNFMLKIVPKATRKVKLKFIKLLTPFML